jgi:gliding motility-associated-like protein
MGKLYCAFLFLLFANTISAQTIIYSEDFDPTPSNWTLNSTFGANDVESNFWQISDDESGMPVGTCGAAGMGNQSLYITADPTWSFGTGALYNAGGFCGFGLFCVETHKRAETPAISTTGVSTTLTLSFDYIEEGDGANDDFFIQYSTNGGGTWTTLSNPAKTANFNCIGQGYWTNYSIALPAACNNISNLKIGFCWQNNDDGTGTDPSVAINDVEITTPGTSNTAPIAINDTLNSPCSGAVLITPSLNDIDSISQTLTTTSVFGASAGLTASVAAGVVTLVPPVNTNGTYTVNYIVTDNGTPALSDTGLIVLTVTGCNSQPNAVADNLPVSCGTSTLTILSNDNDADAGQTLALSNIWAVSAGATAVASGNTVVFNATSNGVYTFQYSICDNGIPSLCDTALVTVTVSGCNNQPNATADNLPVSCGTSTLTILSNDNDPNAGQTITLSNIWAVSAGATAVAAGNTVVFNATSNGVYTFQYSICDNGTPSLCDTALVTVTVSGCITNNPPNAINDSVITICNLPVTINDTDPNAGQTLSLVGTFGLNPGGTISTAGNSISFTPISNQGGLYTFFYIVTDNGSPALLDTAQVFVLVSGCGNTAPLAINDTIASAPCGNSTISPLGNDIEADAGQVLSLSNVWNVSAGATAIAVGNTISFSASANGTYTLQYSICDNGTPSFCDTATIFVTVSGCNDAPNANNDNLPGNCGTTTLTVLGNDTDPNAGQLLSINGVYNISAGATASIVANTIVFNASANGVYTFNYIVCDNGTPSLCDTALATITVSTCNAAPDAVNDAANTICTTPITILPLANDSDPDAGQILSLNGVWNVPLGAVATTSGNTINFTPSGIGGTFTLFYSVCDNGTPSLCDTASIIINATPCNLPPVAVADNYTTACNTAISFTPLANDFDPDGANVGLPLSQFPINANGTFTFNGSVITYTPASGYSGTFTIPYIVSDGNLPPGYDTGTITMTVLSCATVPTANFSVSDTFICEDMCINFFDLSTEFPTSWQWTFQGASPSSSTIQNPVAICYPSPGVYDVTLVSSTLNGSSTPYTRTATIVVQAKPNAQNVTLTDTVGKLVTLDATKPSAVNYAWSPLGGLINTSSNAIKQVQVQVQATYYCEVTTDAGCEVIDTFNIVPIALPGTNNNVLFVPNVFTPNGDNDNDTWKPKTNNIRTYRAMVYNRWGNKVFETDNINFAWTGTYKGKDVEPNDVYFYYVEVEFLDGTKRIDKGDLIIIK